ncbi:MAG: glutathione S-transferase family protein [Pseudomonadota bacterium]
MLTLHYHPLSSYCHKVLIALYENGTPFTPHLVDLGDPAQAAALKALWPMRKFPVLEDRARGQVIAESTPIIDYLGLHYPGHATLVPAAPALAFEVRRWDRFFDLYVHEPMQKIVGDKLRPDGQKDPFGVAQARATLATAYGVIEAHMAGKEWATGAPFTLADCAAAPALYYANLVQPIDLPHTAAYHAHLLARPSCARVLDEARPYFHMFPG